MLEQAGQVVDEPRLDYGYGDPFYLRSGPIRRAVSTWGT